MELFKLLGTIAINNSEANKALGDTSKHASDTADAVKDASNESGKAGNSMTSAFKKVGAAVVAYLSVDAIKNFGLSCIQAAADANAMESQFTQVFGDLEGSAADALSVIADEAGITENRMKGSFTKIAAFAKTTGMDTESALSLSERAMVAVADSAAFYDRSLEDTTESLQSFLKGNFENDAALGLSCTETTRNAAANKLYGKSFKDLSESQKQLTLLQMVEDANKTSGALGQAARESNTWTNQTGNLQQAWTDLKAVLGDPILSSVTSAVGWLAEKVSGLATKFTEGTNPVQFFIDKLKSLGEWFSQVGWYADYVLREPLEKLQNLFMTIKEALQPFIDKLSEYVTSGQAAKDITSLVYDAISLLADVYERTIEIIQSVVQGFKDAVTWGKEHETALMLIAVAVGTLTTAIGAYNVAMAIKKAGGIAEIAQLGILQVQIWALTAAQTAQTVVTNIATAATTAFGAVMSFITSPITLVVVAIGALIAIGILLYKNWDVIKEKCAELWANVKEKFSNMKEAVSNKVSEIKTSAINKFNELKAGAIQKFTDLKTGAVNKFNDIKNGITEKIQSARDKVKGAIDKIKGFFNFSWSLPKLKMPHFSISGGFSLNPPSVPSFSIDWYKKAMDNAMILNKPTIFGYDPASGQYMGGGEAGAEVVSGANTLMGMIQNAVASQNNILVVVLYKILDAILAMDENMGGNLREALDGTALEVNKREFARLVKAVN